METVLAELLAKYQETPNPKLARSIGVIRAEIALKNTRPQRRNDESSLVSHTLFVDGHRTSMRLEPMMWDALDDVADRLGVTIHELATIIEHERTASSLSAAVRMYIVNFYRHALGQSR
jgi:predicted DNA-binding ribbon-helix-helix protein